MISPACVWLSLKRSPTLPLLLLLYIPRPPSKVRQAAAELQRASGLSSPAAAAEDSSTPTSASPAAAAAAAADGGSSSSKEAERALQALLAAMGAGSVQQAAVEHRDMRQRLQRLDEVSTLISQHLGCME
jgi:hypothetical protein